MTTISTTYSKYNVITPQAYYKITSCYFNKPSSAGTCAQTHRFSMFMLRVLRHFNYFDDS